MGGLVRSVSRHAPGTWQLGHRELKEAMEQLFGEHKLEARDTILECMRNAKRHSVRLRAAAMILDRLYGQPVAHVDVKNEQVDEISQWDDRKLLMEAAKVMSKYAGGDIGPATSDFN